MAKKVGRPSMGITKKVSLTLPLEMWNQIELIMKDSNQNQSKVLRDIISDFCLIPYMTPEEEKDYNETFIELETVKLKETGKHHFIKNDLYTVCGQDIKTDSIKVTQNLINYQDKEMCKNCIRLS